MSESNHQGVADKHIWLVLLGIIVLFSIIVLYARNVGISRQEEQAKTPIVARYTNYAYGIGLRYPPEWRPVGGAVYDTYEGTDGFFSISAGGTGTAGLDDMVKAEIGGQKKYGSEPTVLDLRIDGRGAKLIMPSPDQNPAMKGQAALIVRYPKPITIGPNTYGFFVFWADRAHIQDIASSITFVNKQ